VHVGVGFVLELTGHEPAVRLRQLDRLLNHAEGAVGGRGQDHLGAEKAHQAAALNAEAFGHGHDQRVALLGADHRQADPGIAARRLDHSLAGLQFA
jgi:hypothetical protein